MVIHLLTLLATGAPQAPATTPVTGGNTGAIALAASLSGASVAVVTLLIWFLGDRRKSRAETRVSEGSVQADIDRNDVDAQDARLIYVLRQVDAERAFHTQQVADRDAEIARQRAELDRRDELVANLRAQVENLEQQLAAVSRQVTECRTQIDQLANNNND